MPLFYLAGSFLIGVLVAERYAWPADYWLIAGVFCLALSAAVARSGFSVSPRISSRLAPVLSRFSLDPAAISWQVILLLPVLSLAAAFLGAARRSGAEPLLDAVDFIARYNDDGARYSVIGVLKQPPDIRDEYTNLRVSSQEIRLADGFRHLPVRGDLLVRTSPGGDFTYGDRIIVTGRIRTPAEDETFSYRAYLARQGIYAYMSFAEASVLEEGYRIDLFTWIYRLRNRAHDIVYQLYPDPEAGLLSGILLGLEHGMSPGLQDAFRDTGTTHIIAISGFNIAVIAAIFTAAFGRIFGAGVGAAVSIVAIALYTLLVGADAAVVRAAVMGGMAIFFRRSGRSVIGLNSLMITAAGMTFLNPMILSDVGFQLSFGATVGLIFYAQPLSAGFSYVASRYLRVSTVRRILPLVSDAVLLTLAAQLTTLPIVLYHFGRLSLTAFLVNPLILPAQPGVMILGGLSVLGGMAWLPFGQMLAILTYPLTAYTIRVVELFSMVRGGVIVLGELGAGFVYAAILGPLLVYGAWNLGERARAALPWLRLAGLLILLSAGVSTWRTGSAASDGLLRVWVLDVGMGEGILIQTPEDRWILVNGGASTSKLSEQLGRRIPFSQRSLDWLIIAGNSDEQLGALPRLLEQYRPADVLWSGMQNISYELSNMQDIMNKNRIPIHRAQAGQVLPLGQGAFIEVLQVTPRGAVLLLSHGEFRMLIPAGANFDTLEIDLPQVNALLLADHGFEPLNPTSWIETLAPGLILVSVEASNREALPTRELMDTLQGYRVLRTDINGWVGLYTDGSGLWVEAQRP